MDSNALVKSHQPTRLTSQYPRMGKTWLHRLQSCQDELSSSALGERSSKDLGRNRGRPCITAATLQHSRPRCDYTGVSSIVNVRSNYSAAVFLSSDEKAMWSIDSGWLLSRVSDSSLNTKVDTDKQTWAGEKKSSWGPASLLPLHKLQSGCIDWFWLAKQPIFVSQNAEWLFLKMKDIYIHSTLYCIYWKMCYFSDVVLLPPRMYRVSSFHCNLASIYLHISHINMKSNMLVHIPTWLKP